MEQSQRAASLVRALTARENRPVGLGISFLADLTRLERVLQQARHSVRDLSVTNRIGELFVDDSLPREAGRGLANDSDQSAECNLVQQIGQTLGIVDP